MEIVILESHNVPPLLQRALTAEGHRVHLRTDIDTALSADVVLLDTAMWTPADAGRLAERLPTTELICFVDDLDNDLPEQMMTLLRPVDVTKLVRLIRAIDDARRGVGNPRDLVDFETLFTGDSPAIVDLLRQVELVAQSDAPVWIQGELGTGRAVVGRAIHDRSTRAHRMFLGVNAALFPGDQLEEHLFSGAEPIVQQIHGGTLFVDNASRLATGVQARLLRVLEEGRVDIRVLAADERERSDAPSVRRDLSYRLGVHELQLPPLRRRNRDLTAIIERILDRYRFDGKLASLSGDAERMLARYPFPGNIRELAYAITNAVVLARGESIDPEHLPLVIQQTTPPPEAPESLETLEVAAMRFERAYLLRVLRAVGGNRTRAAQILNLSRKGLWQKLKRHGIPSGTEPDPDRDV